MKVVVEVPKCDTIDKYLGDEIINCLLKLEDTDTDIIIVFIIIGDNDYSKDRPMAYLRPYIIRNPFIKTTFPGSLEYLEYKSKMETLFYEAIKKRTDLDMRFMMDRLSKCSVQCCIERQIYYCSYLNAKTFPDRAIEMYRSMMRNHDFTQTCFKQRESMQMPLDPDNLDVVARYFQIFNNMSSSKYLIEKGDGTYIESTPQYLVKQDDGTYIELDEEKHHSVPVFMALQGRWDLARKAIEHWNSRNCACWFTEKDNALFKERQVFALRLLSMFHHSKLPKLYFETLDAIRESFDLNIDESKADIPKKVFYIRFSPPLYLYPPMKSIISTIRSIIEDKDFDSRTNILVLNHHNAKNIWLRVIANMLSDEELFEFAEKLFKMGNFHLTTTAGLLKHSLACRDEGLMRDLVNAFGDRVPIKALTVLPEHLTCEDIRGFEIFNKYEETWGCMMWKGLKKIGVHLPYLCYDIEHIRIFIEMFTGTEYFNDDDIALFDKNRKISFFVYQLLLKLNRYINDDKLRDYLESFADKFDRRQYLEYMKVYVGTLTDRELLSIELP